MHFFIDQISSMTAGWRRASGGWISGNCPCCVRMGEPRADTKRRGGFMVTPESWRYHCFNCGMTAGWEQGNTLSYGARMLLQDMGLERAEVQRINLNLMREKEAKELFSPIIKRKPVYVPEWPEVALPKDSGHIFESPMTSNLEAGIELLVNRGLDHWSDWYYSSADIKYRKRLILPFRHKGKIVGHTARYIGDPPNGMAKYLRQSPSHYVFNLDNQTDDRDCVIVTEGEFDALAFDGVALGTNTISDEQASLIDKLNRKVILLPDADASGARLVGPAIERGWSVSFPPWMETHKDANSASIEYGRVFALYSTMQFATDNPTRAKVKAKMLCK